MLHDVMQKIFLDNKVSDLKSVCENVLKSSPSAVNVTSDEVRISVYFYLLLA